MGLYHVKVKYVKKIAQGGHRQKYIVWFLCEMEYYLKVIVYYLKVN